MSDVVSTTQAYRLSDAPRFARPPAGGAGARGPDDLVRMDATACSACSTHRPRDQDSSCGRAAIQSLILVTG